MIDLLAASNPPLTPDLTRARAAFETAPWIANERIRTPDQVRGDGGDGAAGNLATGSRHKITENFPTRSAPAIEPPRPVGRAKRSVTANRVHVFYQLAFHATVISPPRPGLPLGLEGGIGASLDPPAKAMR